MNQSFDKQSFYILLCKVYDGNLTDIEKQQLNEIIKADDEMALMYLRFFDTISNMKSNMTVSPSSLLSDEVSQYDRWLQEMAEREKTAPGIKVSEEKAQRELIQKVVYQQNPRKISRFAIASVILSAAAILFFVLFLRFAPEKRYAIEVATLIDQINVKWADSSINFESGDRLLTNQMPVGLNTGIIKIQYDDGVAVLIEGPAKFEIERSGVFLEYGRLFSRVSKSGLGFLVETPTARFIDQGTEFGVQADVNGSAELHVIKGKVQLFAGLQGNAKSSQVVTENEAVRYDVNTGKTKAVPVAENAFARSIDSKTNIVWRGQNIDLADIVGGGNGLGTGRIQNSINPATGDFVTWDIPGGNSSTGHNRYLPVDESAFIDGVFVPDGGEGPIQVTSLGDRWQAPDTSNLFKYNIVNSLHILENPSQIKYVGGGNFADQMLRRAIKRDVSTKLMGIEAMGFPLNPTDTNLFIHSSLGITFDLNEIRRLLPDHRIRQFNSLFGVGEGFIEIDNIATESISLDVWVLVDGQVKYYKRGVGITTLLDIGIDLFDEDRFLSLAVTDGEDKNVLYDWGLFVNPRLEAE